MRCEYCKRFLDDLDEEDIIGNACRECYERIELNYEIKGGDKNEDTRN